MVGVGDSRVPESAWTSTAALPGRVLSAIPGWLPIYMLELGSEKQDSHDTGNRASEETGDQKTKTPRAFSSSSAMENKVPSAAEATLEFPQIPGYRIVGELGHGGMGVVYRAFDEQRKQMVALKTVQSLNPRSLYLFKQEFRTLADVSHLNLVTLYELVSDGHLWFFTMELVEGTDFLSHIRFGEAASSTTPLTVVQLDRLRMVLKQLVEGILALHQAGKLHRDIKPSNVLVSRTGRVVLMDFGLAAQLDRAGTHHSTKEHILGTAAYMAPEQAAARPVSPASDWYSVGAMLFQSLTGRLPFRGSAFDMLRKKQEADVTWPATYEPVDLIQLSMDLLQRDPADRPSGEEILRRVTSRLPVSAAVPPISAPRSEPGTFVGRQQHLQARMGCLWGGSTRKTSQVTGPWSFGDWENGSSATLFGRFGC